MERRKDGWWRIDGVWWMVDDFSVAEGNTSFPNDPHRLSPAERATVGVREIEDGGVKM